MSAIPLSETAAKRQIGDILLAHGFVTAAEIADATLEQERTQQPLGQILVGRGSITRLELASALAEQWSDPAASITSTPHAAPPPVAAPSAQDEAQYAARLQEAVADLARKVQSNTPLDGIDERVDELSRRIESTLARTQHIEAAVATLAESLEGVTTGVEEAFFALQTSTSDLVGDLARIEQSVREIANRELPQDDRETLADVEELRAAVADLESRSSSLADISERLARVEADAGDERLRAELEGQARLLDELRATIGELAEQPVGTPEFDERLQRLEIGLAASSSSQVEIATQIDALGARLSDQGGINARVEDVTAQLERLESRVDGHAAGVEELGATLALLDHATVAGRIDDLARTLDHLRNEIADVAASSGPDPGIGARLDTLTAQVEELAREREESKSLVAQVGALETLLAEGVVAPEALTRAIEAITPDSSTADELAPRLAALETLLAEGIVTPEVLTRSIERATSERSDPAADERVAAISAEVTELRGAVAALSMSAGASGDDERLVSLAARLDGLVHDRAAEVGLAARLDAMERARTDDVDTIDVLARAMDRIRHDLTGRAPAEDAAEVIDAVARLALRIDALEESRVAPEPPPDDHSELIVEVERFRLMLERIGLHLGEHDRALADLGPIRGAEERLGELTVLVHDLAKSQAGLAPASAAASPFAGDVGSLLERVEQAESASQTDNERLMNRLERMATSIDWRLQRLEANDTVDAE